MWSKRKPWREALSPSEQEAVLTLIATFSTAEFELKARGFALDEGGRARANWGAFAVAIEDQFRPGKSVALSVAWRSITSNPLPEQVMQSGDLAWRAVARPPGVSDAAWGLELVRRTHDNLFHCREGFLGGLPESAEQIVRVSAAITVLNGAMMAAPWIRHRAA